MLNSNNFMHRCAIFFLVFNISRVGFSECAKVVIVIGNAKSNSNSVLQPGQEVSSGTKIKTQSNSFVKLILKDGSIVDVGPSSLFTISSCEVTHQVLKFNLELELGKVRANVIKNEKSGKRELNLKTPTSLLGVRGTEFFVSWEKDSFGNVQEQISVSHGQIEVRSLFDQKAGSMIVSQGTELKAEGRIEKSRTGVRVKEGSAVIDQFTATEQKTIESNTKVEQNPFEAKVELKRDRKESAQNADRQNSNETFVVDALSTKRIHPRNIGDSKPSQNTSQPVASSTETEKANRGPASQSDESKTSSGGPTKQPPAAQNGNQIRPSSVSKFEEGDGNRPPGGSQSDAPLKPPTRIDPSQLGGTVAGGIIGVNNVGFVSIQGFWGAKKK